MEHTLAELSNELALAVEKAAQYVVAVHARPRFSSSGLHWKEGLIVTADHTVKSDDEITVTLPGGRTVPAELKGRDAGTDLAVLKIEPGDTVLLTPPFADPDSARAGSLALAVGRSADTGPNATMGVISAVSGKWRTWRGGMLDQFIRLDLALYPGSSGGAVVNTAGEVLGIATSGLSRTSGLAIPAATVNRVLEALTTRGHVTRGYLGVGLQPVELPDHLTSKLGLRAATGLIVLTVEEKSPAERAGWLLGDILATLNGEPVTDTDEVQRWLDSEFVGKTLAATVIRGGELVTVPVEVGERPRRS